MRTIRRGLLTFLVLASLLSSLPVGAFAPVPSQSTPATKAEPLPPRGPHSDPAAPEAVTAFSASLNLNGTSQYVSVPDDDALTPASALTIEAWVRRASVGCQTIVGKNYSQAFWLGFCNNVIRFYSGGVGTLQDGATTIPANVWTHIAVTWDTATDRRRYYINGELDYSNTAGAGGVNNASPLYLGYDPFPCCYYAGNLAEVRIWSVARTQNDIRRTMHVALDEPRPGLVANWHLTDNFKDNIGGHDGTAVGGAALTGPQAPPRPALVPVDQYFGRLPTTRDGAAFAYVPTLNRAVLIGGYVSNALSGSIDRVDVATGAQTNLGNLGAALRYSMGAYAPSSDAVYVFGGNTGSVDLPRIYAISPYTGSPRLLAATLPISASAGAAIYHAGLGKVVVIGAQHSIFAPNGISLFDPATETLTPLTLTLPVNLYGFAAAYSSLTDRVYVFGGRSASGMVTTTYQIALQPDGLIGSVTLLPSAALPRPTERMAAVEDPATHLIYILGGSGSDRAAVFDPATGQTWETTIQLPDQRADYAAVFDGLNHQAIVLGGYLGTTKQDIWRIPLGDGPSVATRRWDFPASPASAATSIDGDDQRVAVGTTSNGLYVYNPDGTRTLWGPGSLGSASGKVNDVRYSARNDQVWAATNDAGGKLISGGVITTFDNTVLGTNIVSAVDVYPNYNVVDGAPFFGTVNQGLWWKAYSLFPLPGGYFWRNDFPGRSMSALAHRAPGDVWGLNSGSVTRMMYTYTLGSTSVTTATYPSMACSLVDPTDLAFDQNGDLWVVSPNYLGLAANAPQGFAGQGICQVVAPTGAAISNLRIPAIGAAANHVSVDADGRVWVSVGWQTGESGGLVTYQNLSGTLRVAETNWLTGPVGSLITVTDGFSVTGWNSGLSAVGAADERVWASKSNGGLVTVAPRWQQFDEVNGLAQQRVNGVWTARGRLFLASRDDAFNYYLRVLAPDGKTWDTRLITDGAVVWSVLGDSHGRTWLGTNTGVRHYLPAGYDLLTDTVGTAPSSAVYALAEDQNGRVWMGGLNGLTLFDRERFVATFDAGNSPLPNSQVNALLVDRSNHVWIGTGDGLARLRDNVHFDVFSTTHGLPSNYIHDLAQAGDGRIAVSTDSGVAFFDGASGFYTETLPMAAVNLPLTVDDQGRLWAGEVVRNSGGWQAYYVTDSGLRSQYVLDNAADGAGYIWFAHYPDLGVSVRGTYLPPLGTVLPTIYGLTPSSGSAGTVITITGSGFSRSAADVNVTIGGSPVTLLNATESQLMVRVNENTISGDVSVNSRGQRVTYTGSGGNRAFCAVPVLNGFTPTGGNDGVPISLTGTNFDPQGVRVFLGGATTHSPFSITPTELRVYIQPGDGSGAVQVRNSVSGCPTFTSTSSTMFNHVSLSLAQIALNQGMPVYGLTAHRPTLVSSFLSRGVALRSTDQLQIDSVQIRFSNGAGAMVTRTFPYVGAVPSSLGAPSAALQRDLVNSVNVPNVSPSVTGFAEGNLTTRVTLFRRGYVIAQASRTDAYMPNRLMRVMLVPIMHAGYTRSDLVTMQTQVNSQLEDLRRRTMPTGDVEFIWSPTVLTKDGSVNLGDYLGLYDTSHSMDRIRRQWNEASDRDALIAFGVVEESLRSTNTTGLGFWPDLIDLINVIAGPLDTLCDIGNTALQILTFGLAGSSDGCHLEVPLYIGWATSGGIAGDVSGQASSLFGHEFGHIMGLVNPLAPNGSFSDNFSHSVNDELDGGECGDGGATYNANKTLYRQPGVSEPVVNPITGQQFRAQLSVQDDGNPASQATQRGKAIMSYACQATNAGTFFEPVDTVQVLAEFIVSSARSFFHDLRPGSGLLASARSENATLMPAASGPTPRTVIGQRLVVSGEVNRALNSGMLRRVEALGDDAPLSPSFNTGYWLVQRSLTGTELSRTGVYPVFTASEATHRGLTQVITDTGFFAATILRATGVVTLELRHDNTMLSSFHAGNASPSVSLSQPAAGSYSVNVPVAWSASDGDGDPLNFVVEYSPDNGSNWMPVAFVTTTAAINVPVFQLAGSGAARMRVIASDGFHTGVATSTLFSVAYQPPYAFINQPTTATVALEGQYVSLAGGALDNQDGMVADVNLSWRSNRDGNLGNGSSLDVLLSVGTHVLTLQARNSVGLTSTATTTVTVQGDYDGDGLPDARESSSSLNPLTESDGFSDADGDGLPLVMELMRNTNPIKADSDGDGVSDAAEIAAGTDPNSSSDSVLPPDRLSASPTTLVYTANLALDNPLPQQFVQLTSRAPALWTVTSDVAWLAVSAASGATPVADTVLVDAFLLREGAYTGHLYFASASLGNTVNVTVTVNVTNTWGWYDVNQDGVVNYADVLDEQAHLGTNNSQPGFIRRYDLDRDGDTDAVDLQLLLDYLFPRKVYLPIVLR